MNRAAPRWEDIDYLRNWLLWCAHMQAGGNVYRRTVIHARLCKEHGV